MSDVLDEYEQLESDYGQLLAEWFLDITVIYDDAKQNIPSQDVYNQILCDQINANIILELGEVYDAYVSDPAVDTVKALVEKYDEIFSATEMFLPEE